MNIDLDDVVSQLCGKTHEELVTHGVEFESTIMEYARKMNRRGLTDTEELELANIELLHDIVVCAKAALSQMQSEVPWCIARPGAKERTAHK
jgi:hypothetical protein